MAGDWIKMEKCSPNKPEVMRLARLWGVPQDQAFGILFRFWAWADDATVDGLVDGVASHEVDAMMRMDGFSQGLVAVGWLQINDSKPCLRIPNFEKHNSESAKNRALKRERQARWRAGKGFDNVDGGASTREEKRRDTTNSSELLRSSSSSGMSAPSAPTETTPSPKTETSKPALQGKVNGHPASHGSRLAEDWRLPDDWKQWAFDACGVDPQKAVRISLRFRDYWVAKPGSDGRKADWQATWRNWVRKEIGDA